MILRTNSVNHLIVVMETCYVFFEVLSLHLPGGTEGNHEKPQSGQPVSGPIFEPVTSRIRSRRIQVFCSCGDTRQHWTSWLVEGSNDWCSTYGLGTFAPTSGQAGSPVWDKRAERLQQRKHANTPSAETNNNQILTIWSPVVTMRTTCFDNQ
jgi:hypothetical protein